MLSHCLPAAVLATALVAGPAAAQAPELVNIDFRGGSVADFVQAIRKEVPDANILLTEEASRVPVPAVRLKNVTIDSAIEVLRPLTLETAQEHVRITTDVSRHPPGRAVYSVLAKVNRGGQPQQTRVLAVGHILAGDMKPEALLTAIETGLSLFGAEYDAAELRFHEATGLIIARGHPQQIGLISEVIDQVYANVKTDRAHQSREQSLLDAEERVATLEAALARSQAHGESFRLDATELRTQVDLLSRHLEQSMQGLAKRETEVAALRTDITQVRTALADAQARLDGRKQGK